MQKIRISATSDACLDLAKIAIPNQSFLYNKQQNVLYIKYNEELKKLGADVDETNLIFKEKDGTLCISLSDDIVVESTDVSPNNVVHVENKLLLENITSPNKQILLILKISDTIKEGIYGEIFRFGNNISEGYHISVSSKSKNDNTILGSSSDKVAEINKYRYNDELYYGIKFSTTDVANLYFHGVNNIKELEPPSVLEYNDSQLTEA